MQQPVTLLKYRIRDKLDLLKEYVKYPPLLIDRTLKLIEDIEELIKKIEEQG